MHEVKLLHDQRIPMRDGINLSGDVYLPLQRGDFPTVVQWTPYESTRDRFVTWGVGLASRGYSALVVDTRGRYESDGVFEPYVYDGRDAFDTLSWAANQSWSNGRIGTWGRSYGGIVQWELARLGHPNLECIAPHVIHDDPFWNGYWTGGVFQLPLLLGALIAWEGARGLIIGSAARSLALNDRVFAHLPLIDLDELALGRRVSWWRSWWEHQTNDSFWQQFRSQPERVEVPIFQQGGWFDPYAGGHLSMSNVIGNRVPNRVLIGPWSHEEDIENFKPDVDVSAGLTVIHDHDLLFYDRYLKDEENGWEHRPRHELFVLGANEWSGQESWPLPNTQYTPFHLRQGGRLTMDPPGASEPPDEYLYDPADPVPSIGGVSSIASMTAEAQTPVRPGPIDQRSIERRPDVLVYTSDPMREDVRAIGPVDVTLYASSSAKDTDFVVRLCDVLPDGRSIVLTEGFIRARYRNSTRGETTELLEPGEAAVFQITLYPIANLFRRGHCIRLDVTSSSFPRLARNLNTGENVATGTRMRVARQRVLHTSAYRSHVVIPVVAT